MRFLSCKWLLASTLFTCLLACKGEDGAVGPAGPAGPAGAQGIQGVAGSTANLVVSAWTKVASTAWVANQNSSYFLVSLDEKTITQANLDKALIMAYYRNSGRDNVVFSLPTANQDLALGFFMQVRDSKGTMNFDLTYGQPRLEPIDFDLEFRWVIVPPATGGRLKHIDWANYSAVKQELGLND
jgi:hypothetical protein